MFVQEVAWGEHDAHGRPVGSGCQLDMSVACEAFPKMDFETIATNFHERGSSFKKQFLAAKANRQKVGDLNLLFQPAEEVTHLQIRSITVSVKHAFVTESEIIRLTEATPRALGLGKPGVILIEDGSTLQGWLMSLRDIDPQDAKGLRKVKVEMSSANQLQETLMDSSRQLRKEQPSELWELAAQTQTTSGPKGLTPSGRNSLLTLPSLREKASMLKQAQMKLLSQPPVTRHYNYVELGTPAEATRVTRAVPRTWQLYSNSSC